MHMLTCHVHAQNNWKVKIVAVCVTDMVQTGKTEIKKTVNITFVRKGICWTENVCDYDQWK